MTSKKIGTPSKASAEPIGRPALPVELINPGLAQIPPENYTVKYQTIVREGSEIIVGRVKVPTPEGHAFILRRYDTGAFSLTTMFKASFVGDTAEAEKHEISWVKATYPTGGANGGSGTEAVRLAGTWIPASVAVEIAQAYNIVDLISALADANPDPSSTYRKSQRSNTAAITAAPSSLPAPAAKRTKTVANPSPTKAPAFLATTPSTLPPTPSLTLESAPSSSPSASATSFIPLKPLFPASVDVKQSAADIEYRRIQAEAEIEAQKKLVADIMPKVAAKRARVSAASSMGSSQHEEEPQQIQEPEVLATITTTTVTTTTEGEEPTIDTTISVSSSPSIPHADAVETNSPLNLGPVIPPTSSSPSKTTTSLTTHTSPQKRRSNKRERSPSVEVVEESSVAVASSMSSVEEVEEEEQELEEGRKIATNRRAMAAEALARERAGPMQTFKQAVWGAAVFGVGMGVTTILPRFFF